MALETIASLSDLFSSLLPTSSPTPPYLSPSTRSLKPTTTSSTLPSSISQQLSITTKIFFTSCHHDVSNPSLTYANLFFYKSGHYNVEIVPKEGESEEQLVNDFRRSVFRAGVIQETRRRQFFESCQEKRKRKTKEAARRNRKRRPIPKPKPLSTQEINKNRKASRQAEEDDDNWELPPQEIEIPYTNRS